ncbi:16S rRNA (cytosine(967)-C(5))-methyltransferase RsmB [Tuwongella immobilis]|uniref:16S rRNA (cytosine(967)-C(5))-methyltransferase n=1 Tax=Tuwongella immobilis TaxID=692036 RepID=A0A6C2YVX6_9BACT|nr:16S rRNA (cytosine(967)-C(5))-methyltransferase RsmB [Tuwongella immobilis]VIP05055.1 sun protein : Sun protein OS=Planctomyces limnophilus (strain ATCC 43296 / DSM 3776 / IFAM 1008 / 290) GN=Plim_1107 PE=4 SV=1: NusB: Nol1_Nop2_Fmu [Tuwongella immobilis]VTS07466.1 sun protein : Sun protein OS=Planctomyces limnophilus (strain ATCC 43296 / DSM 3776 / IFAM 1008 / 290) GN=Plim_1107 PE=4 SV=1: NusB: Nol1_Nop2_Fmu [Tuwongella immobilis]
MTPRHLVLQMLARSRKKESFSGAILDDALTQAVGMSPVDKRLATHLFLGMIRREATLDAMMKPFSHRPLIEIQSEVRDLVRMGIYQIACMTQIPPHAAVYETVEIARAVNPRSLGFVNGVLRRITELVTDRKVYAPSEDALPMDDGHYRQLSRNLFPDPRRMPAEYLAEAFGWPFWLSRRRIAQLGWDSCLRQGFWFLTHPPLYLRVNRLKTTREAYMEMLTAANIAHEPATHPQAIRMIGGHNIRALPGYAEGLFAVQDESSIRVGSALSPKPGMRVLDLCAAPGGKTTHLAELMDNQGEIIACDIEADRLKSVSSLAERLGLACIQTQAIAKDGTPPDGPFDMALVDVPCSNTGVMGRRPELRNRLKPNELPHLVQLQTRLLEQAADRVKPGGVLVYSTCSIEPEEDGLLARAFPKLRPEWVIEADELTLPGRPSDGGYWARFRRQG